MIKNHTDGVIRRHFGENVYELLFMKKLQSIATLLLAALFFGAGYVENSAANETPGTSTASPNAASHVIAVIPKLTNTVFWQSVLAGAKEAGKDFGYEIVWDGPDRETNSIRQIQIE